MKPSIPSSSADGAKKTEETPSGEGDFFQSLGNLLVFCAVLLLALGGFFLFRYWSTSSEPTNHFLANTPFVCVELLEPLLGGEKIYQENLKDKTVLVILWGPWSEESCRFIPRLKEVLAEAEEKEDFLLIPVAYFAHTPKKDTSGEEIIETAMMKAAMLQEEPLRLNVEQAFQLRNFVFSHVWWDPGDRMRNELMELAGTRRRDDPSASFFAPEVDGIGFPTVILVRKEIIHAVWQGDIPQNVDEIKKYLLMASYSEADPSP